MSGTSFYKMTGSGNDFVMLDGRSTTAADWSADADRRDLRPAEWRRRGRARHPHAGRRHDGPDGLLEL